jgi:uncharacterized RDD family membrane protein YckC
MEDFINYQIFSDLQEASLLVDLLNTNQIPFEIDDSSMRFDIAAKNINPLEDGYIIKIREIDKEKVDAIYLKNIFDLTDLPTDFNVPFDSSDEDLESEENEILKKSASDNKRIVNYLLDLLFIFIFDFIFIFILVTVLVIVAPKSLSFFEGENRFQYYLFGLIFSMIYFSLFEALTGRTLAKFITKTKVVTENGEKPNFKTILIRTLCRFIPFEPASFIFSDRGWHDKWSKTIVIDTKKNEK